MWWIALTLAGDPCWRDGPDLNCNLIPASEEEDVDPADPPPPGRLAS